MSTVFGRVGRGVEGDDEQPGLLGLLSAALTASPLGVIRMPLSPRAMAFSMAVIWAWVSPSCLPAATVSLTLSFFAAASAPFCMDTKYGLVSVLRISETPTVLPVGTAEVDAPAAAPLAAEPAAEATVEAAADAALAPPPLEEELQAVARVRHARPARPTPMARRDVIEVSCIDDTLRLAAWTAAACPPMWWPPARTRWCALAG